MNSDSRGQRSQEQQTQSDCSGLIGLLQTDRQVMSSEFRCSAALTFDLDQSITGGAQTYHSVCECIVCVVCGQSGQPAVSHPVRLTLVKFVPALCLKGLCGSAAADWSISRPNNNSSGSPPTRMQRCGRQRLGLQSVSVSPGRICVKY